MIVNAQDHSDGPDELAVGLAALECCLCRLKGATIEKQLEKELT